MTLSTAVYVGIEPIAAAAGMVAKAAVEEPELNEIVRLTSDLLDLCRSTQGAFLRSEVTAR